MKRTQVKRAAPGELAYIRHLERVSAFELMDQDRARLLPPEEYPEPVQRFLAREQTMVHVRIPPVVKRKLEAHSRRSGVAVDKLARRWIEEGVKRDAG
jgi:hypothetical protein